MNFIQHLPDDLVLNHIFDRLDFTSRVRARGVCRAWRHLCHLPPPPWLCATNASSIDTNSLQELSLTAPCIPVANLCVPIDIVGSHGQYVIGNHAISGSPLIYNPFTGETIPLPKTISINGSRDVDPMCLPLRLAQISSPPFSTGGGCVVAAMDNAKKLCVLRFGVDKDWTCLPPYYNYVPSVTDLLFRGGDHLCYIKRHLSMMSWKLQHLFISDHLTFERREFSPPGDLLDWNRGTQLICRHIVESCGEVLVVTLRRRLWPGDCPKFIFEVHRLEEEGLVPVEDLGDRMLLVGRACSRSWSGEGSSCGFFAKNCIYLVTWCDCCNLPCIHGHRRCVRDEERVHKLWKLCLLNKQVVGPVLISSLGSPVWITPGAS